VWYLLLKAAFDTMDQINGKADIARWDILQQYGGIWVDADSFCIKPFDELLDQKISFFAGTSNNINI
jgi:mannosyltransferase OCH1-like enzyme